jgi:hypothetical protein
MTKWIYSVVLKQELPGEETFTFNVLVWMDDIELQDLIRRMELEPKRILSIDALPVELGMPLSNGE